MPRAFISLWTPSQTITLSMHYCLPLMESFCSCASPPHQSGQARCSVS